CGERNFSPHRNVPFTTPCVSGAAIAQAHLGRHYGAAPPRKRARSFVVHPTLVERAKLFLYRYFERIFVLLLVGAMVVIHTLVEQKFAFLSFYYLSVILAGFCGGRRVDGVSGVGVGCVGVFF